jgi:hypothetical protein
MGAAASVPDEVNLGLAKQLAGDKFDQDKWDSLAGDAGTVSRDQFLAAEADGSSVGTSEPKEVDTVPTTQEVVDQKATPIVPSDDTQLGEADVVSGTLEVDVNAAAIVFGDASQPASEAKQGGPTQDNIEAKGVLKVAAHSATSEAKDLDPAQDTIETTQTAEVPDDAVQPATAPQPFFLAVGLHK